jgi:hypothetical protein
MAYAFRCLNCNSLEESAHAGERAVPAKCRTCGAGVSYSSDGIKTYHPENWVVLADLPEDELQPILEYHALDVAEVEAHVPADPATPDHEPVEISVETEDATPAQEDVAR